MSRKNLVTEVTKGIDEGAFDAVTASKAAAALQALDDNIQASLKALRSFIADRSDRNDRYETALGKVAWKAGTESHPKVTDPMAYAMWLRERGMDSLTIDCVMPTDEAMGSKSVETILASQGVDDAPGLQWSAAREPTVSVTPVADWQSIMNDQRMARQAMEILTRSLGVPRLEAADDDASQDSTSDKEEEFSWETV